MVGLKSIPLPNLKQVKEVTVEGNRVYFPPGRPLPGAIPGRASLWFWLSYFQIDKLTGGKEWEKFLRPTIEMVNAGNLGVTFIKYDSSAYTLTNFYYLTYKEVMKVLKMQGIEPPPAVNILQHEDVAHLLDVEPREVQLMCLGGEPCMVVRYSRRPITPGWSHVDIPGVIKRDGREMIGSVRPLGRRVLFVGIDGDIALYPTRDTIIWRVANQYLVKIPSRR